MSPLCALGTVNVCAKCYVDPSSSCWEISVWTTVADQPTDWDYYIPPAHYNIFTHANLEKISRNLRSDSTRWPFCLHHPHTHFVLLLSLTRSCSKHDKSFWYRLPKASWHHPLTHPPPLKIKTSKRSKAYFKPFSLQKALHPTTLKRPRGQNRPLNHLNPAHNILKEK